MITAIKTMESYIGDSTYFTNMRTNDFDKFSIDLRRDCLSNLIGTSWYFQRIFKQNLQTTSEG